MRFTKCNSKLLLSVDFLLQMSIETIHQKFWVNKRAINNIIKVKQVVRYSIDHLLFRYLISSSNLSLITYKLHSCPVLRNAEKTQDKQIQQVNYFIGFISL